MEDKREKFLQRKITIMRTWLKKIYFTYKDFITLIIIPIVFSVIGLFISCEANRTAKRISDITNRPYILFEDVGISVARTETTKEKVSLSLVSNFSLHNNGTLPAWIIGYDIYLKGKTRVIKALFAPQDKPTQNFTIGSGKNEERYLWFSLVQGINEKDGDADEFKNAQYKLILIVTHYRALGDSNNRNEFTYWELFRLDTKDERSTLVQCGTDKLGPARIKEIFANQENRFTNNTAE